MSHAANLRKQQHSTSQLESPAKRRKLSTGTRAHESNGVPAIINGAGGSTITATSTKDATKNTPHISSEANAKVTYNEKETDNSSGSDSSDGDSEDDAEDSDSDLQESVDSEENPVPVATEDDEADEPSSPTFAELIERKEPTTIDLTHDASSTTLAGHPSIQKALSVPNATTLTTVLSQALRTNDVDLLETCLSTASLDSIRATIERMHSSLAANLLAKLAARMHRRPGRAGNLMVWVQWTVVAHGGYLASQPAAMKEVRRLYQVVQARAAGLQPLLALKGKLDLLDAQLELRRNLKSRERQEQEDDGVVYVEGQDEELEDEDDEDQVKGMVDAVISDDESAVKFAQQDRDAEVSGSEDEDEDSVDEEAEEESDSRDSFSDEVDVEDDEEDASDLSDDGGDAEAPLQKSDSLRKI